MKAEKQFKMKCSLLTNHVCIHTTGEYRLCCASQEESKIHNVKNLSPINWLASDYIQNIKNTFEQDIWPISCVGCQRREDNGLASKRLLSNELYSGDGIKYIDVRLGNTCNLRCQMCWPVSSSKIAKDMEVLTKQFGTSPWTSMIPLSFVPNSNWQDSIEILDKLIVNGLEEIYITGGEPFLNKHLVKLLSKIPKSVKIRFNTNGTIFNKQIANELDKFSYVQIDVSIDAYGQKNDYIRADSTWKDIDTNIDLFKEFAVVNATPTVSVYNVLYLKELYDFCHSKDIKCHPDELIGPTKFCISNAPDAMKAEIKGFENLINVPSLVEEQQDFIRYVKQTDSIRNIDIRQSLPEVAKFYGID